MSETLDVLVVGCGAIAGGYDAGREGGGVLTHAHAYRDHDGFRIVACVDPDVQARERFMAAWSVPHGFDDLETALVSGARYDVVSLCSPTDSHAAALDRLARADVRGVFAEKPLSDDAAVGDSIVRAFENSGRPLAVNHLRRWDASMQALREELASGRCGALRAVVAWYAKGVINNGSHLVDLLHFLVGPTTIRAVTGARVDHAPRDPTVDAVLELPGGVPAHLVGGDARDLSVFEVQILTERCRIDIESSGYRLRRRARCDDPRYPGYRTLDEGAWQDTGLDRALAHAVDNLYVAVTRGAGLASSGRTALAAQAVCEALRDEAASRGLA